MNEGLIAKRYTRALLEFATEREEDKALYERMRILSETIMAVPQLRETLQSPVVTPEDKRDLLYTASGGGSPEESYKGFVRIVLANERERLVQFIAISYVSLYRRENHITVVSLISVFPMSDNVVERIREDVRKRTHSPVEIENHIDPSIEGGFILQIDDFRLDASVKGQLEKIRRQLAQRNRIIV